LSVPLKNLRESWIISNESPIHYWHSDPKISTNAPTTIHLHGFAISGRLLLPTADLLATTYRTLVPNLPGYGRSVRPPHVLSIPELGQSVLQFMDAAGVERATLIGHSMGCIVALEAVRAAPDRFDGIVLVSPAGSPNNRPVFKNLGQLVLDGFREPPRALKIAIPDYFRFGIINACKLFWQMIHYSTIERLRELTKPTLVVLGAHDPFVNDSRVTEESKGNAHIQIVRIEGAAHAVNFSHPRKLAHLVRQFMQGQPLTDDVESKGTAVILKRSLPTI
jgi:pimeloyl-ACP methyl ester carboxylesterase